MLMRFLAVCLGVLSLAGAKVELSSVAGGSCTAFDVTLIGNQKVGIAGCGLNVVVFDIGESGGTRVLGRAYTGGLSNLIRAQGTIAYLTTREKLLSLDLSDPAQPKILGGYANGNGELQDLQIAGNIAYASFGVGGLEILDVSNPRSITKVSSMAFPGLPGKFPQSSFSGSLIVSGKYLFVNETTVQPGIRTIDISNPMKPAQIDHYGILIGNMIMAGTHIITSSYAQNRLDILDFDSKGTLGPNAVFLIKPDYRLNGLTIGNTLAAVQDTILFLENGYTVRTFESRNGQYAMGPTASLDSTQVIRDLSASGNRVYLSSMDGSIIESEFPMKPRIQARRIFRPDAIGPVQSMAVDKNKAYAIDPFRGLTIMDATDPNSFKQIGSYLGSDFWGAEVYKPDIDVKGNTAALVDGNTLFFLLDVSDPNSPALSTRIDYPNIGNGNTSHGVAIHGKYAYHVGDGNGLMRIFDITNPKAPVEKARYTIPLHPPGALPSYNTIATHGGYAFVGGCAGIEVLSLADPEAPVEKNLLASDAGTGCWTTGIALEGRFAYECIGHPSGNGGKLRVFDILDPENPALVDSAQIAGWPYDVSVRDGFVYLSCDRDGLVVLKHQPGIISAIHAKQSRPHPLRPGHFSGTKLGAFNLLGRSYLPRP